MINILTLTMSLHLSNDSPCFKIMSSSYASVHMYAGRWYRQACAACASRPPGWTFASSAPGDACLWGSEVRDPHCKRSRNTKIITKAIYNHIKYLRGVKHCSEHITRNVLIKSQKKSYERDTFLSVF